MGRPRRHRPPGRPSRGAGGSQQRLALLALFKRRIVQIPATPRGKTERRVSRNLRLQPAAHPAKMAVAAGDAAAARPQGLTPLDRTSRMCCGPTCRWQRHINHVEIHAAANTPSDLGERARGHQPAATATRYPAAHVFHGAPSRSRCTRSGLLMNERPNAMASHAPAGRHCAAHRTPAWRQELAGRRRAWQCRRSVRRRAPEATAAAAVSVVKPPAEMSTPLNTCACDRQAHGDRMG